MITVVTKPFESGGRHLASGEVVDSSEWRNESRLINSRYLRAATESEVADFKAGPTEAPRQATPPAPKPSAKAEPKRTAKATVRPRKTEPEHSI